MNEAAYLIAAVTLGGLALVVFWIIRADDGDPPRPSGASQAVEKNPRPPDDPGRALREAVEAGERAAVKKPGEKGEVFRLPERHER